MYIHTYICACEHWEGKQGQKSELYIDLTGLWYGCVKRQEGVGGEKKKERRVG